LPETATESFDSATGSNVGEVVVSTAIVGSGSGVDGVAGASGTGACVVVGDAAVVVGAVVEAPVLTGDVVGTDRVAMQGRQIVATVGIVMVGAEVVGGATVVGMKIDVTIGLVSVGRIARLACPPTADASKNPSTDIAASATTTASRWVPVPGLSAAFSFLRSPCTRSPLHRLT
jgi:hypothetical protein